MNREDAKSAKKELGVLCALGGEKSEPRRKKLVLCAASRANAEDGDFQSMR
jgi:hypothetical protein